MKRNLAAQRWAIHKRILVAKLRRQAIRLYKPDDRTVQRFDKLLSFLRQRGPNKLHTVLDELDPPDKT